MPTQKQLLAHADAHPAHSTPQLPIAESDVTGLVAAIAAKVDKSSLDADSTMAGNSDIHAASQKAVKTALALKLDATAIDTDSTFAANSDTKVASQKALKAALATYTKAPVAAPATAASTGVAGTWAFDATHLYVCIATNTWVRCTLATW